MEGAGGTTNDLKWEVQAPYRVSISSNTASNIARRAGNFEGRPVTAARYVPCAVAESVADRVMQAWEDWPGNSGIVGVYLAVATGKPFLGRFQCTGKTTHVGGAAETCEHGYDGRIGPIGVKFTIKPGPD